MTGREEMGRIAAALKNARQDRDRAAYFVASERLGVPRDQQPEVRLVQLLRDDPEAMVSVEGPAGAGKTSLIVYAMGHLPAFNHVSIVVRVPVGDPAVTFDKLQSVVLEELEEMLASAAEQSRLETVGKNIDLDQLAAAVAEKTTVTQPGASTAAQVGVRAFLTTALTRTIHEETIALQKATSATLAPEFCATS